MSRKESEKKLKPVIFRMPKECVSDFLALKRVGYGDTEIVVACLGKCLKEIKAELLEKRAQESAEELQRLRSEAMTAQATLPQTGPRAQHPERIRKARSNSEPKKQ